MSDIAIRVENLSKQYRIGQREVYRTLRDTLTDTMYAPFRRVRAMVKRRNGEREKQGNTESQFSDSQLPRFPDSPYLWALKDVSFEVRRGVVVGIPSPSLRTSIGRNGAGRWGMGESGNGSGGEPFLRFTDAPAPRFSHAPASPSPRRATPRSTAGWGRC
jgi:hypothetical protein